ncbi:40S ribosomal protein S25 [Emergomyces africanus]|uniref:40S ribosomal protein S25 n=1 Tax=Emergomyces africanus TaxID=1955775 RepID=A0A1B7NUU1_9EURO|nr:40S ribosomal protein S25 [Emergomyces africanus]
MPPALDTGKPRASRYGKKGPGRKMKTDRDWYRHPQQAPVARSRRRSGPRAKVRMEITRKRRLKDKANHAVVLDKATSEKLYKDVQSYRLITVATLVDRLKINGSLARQALSDLEEKGQIKKVVGHSKMNIYSRLNICCCFPTRLICDVSLNGRPFTYLPYVIQYNSNKPVLLARAVTAAE